MPHRNVRLDSRYDWVGPADEVSRIRPLKFRRSNVVSEVERNYLQDREELNQWNSAFWRRHNQQFERKKSEFVAQQKAKLGIMDQIQPKDWSEFYRKFLNENQRSLAAYNTEWYKRNAALIWPQIRVTFIRLLRRLRR
ncbi:hypothetical protein M3Y99_01134600 [Aphelenchoides fujianensis]|nr:hypothetical protein M3Y99_01482600 [Aphelenchoides fujianensis]KAI6229760.1 hypothetical protein M3Y99_01134600 [Aphelenchoides fujianensis]